MTERDLPSRHKWLPSPLSAFFGEEPVLLDPLPAIRDVVAAFAAQAGTIRDRALHDVASIDRIGSELLSFDGGPWSTPLGATDDVKAPMRVVLMGRTMAGKSSLLSALSGSHFDRIGDGRQRFSRDVFAATPKASSCIEVVDTPGVGARDGAEDFELAFTAAQDADLILWVASSDSIQEDTASALRALSLIGKPIIVALNCRQSLKGVGKLNLLKFPESVFGHREGLVDDIRRHMATAGVEPIDVVYVHALAAAEALEHGGETDVVLRKASRIDDLTEALNREYATHSESRRTLRVVDGQRRQVDQFTFSLIESSAAFRAQANHNRGLNDDLHARLARVLRSGGEAIVSDIAISVGRRRSWHLTVTEFGKTLQQDWGKELNALQSELNTTLDIRFSQLQTDIDSSISAADAEWSYVSPDQFALRGLTGFDSILAHRMARVGIAAVAVTGALVGAKLGALIGGISTGPLAPVGAPVGAVVGTVVGAGIAAALQPLKRYIDKSILGTEGVLRKRRDELARLIGPLLDELQGENERVADEHLGLFRATLASGQSKSEGRSAALDQLAARWTHHSEALGALIRELDKETAAALLRVDGRERLARSLKRATRVPGVCILAEFENFAFSESRLFPPDLGEKLAAGRVPSIGGEAAGALSYTLDLIDAPARLSRADSASATVCVDDDLPAGIAETWSDALTSHIGKHIRIESTRRTSGS